MPPNGPVSIDEEELLRCLHAPETRREAFEKVIKLYSRPLYGQIRRIVLSHNDTDDVLQEVLLKAWKGIQGFRGDSKLYTWLYRIAYYEALNFVRQKRRKQTNEIKINDENSYLVDNVAGDAYFDGDEVELKFQKAIASLPSKQRQVFLLRYYDELPYNDIAEMTGTSEGALKASYHHAVKKIKLFLKGED